MQLLYLNIKWSTVHNSFYLFNIFASSNINDNNQNAFVFMLVRLSNLP